MNDILPIVNTVLKTNHENLDQVSDRELTRAYMILRIQVLLGETGQPAPVRITELPGGHVPFWMLEVDALFLENGNDPTLEKTHPDERASCDNATCTMSPVRWNARKGEQRFHVCPDTPVLEVPF